MVLGVGTDILRMSRLSEASLREGDAFLAAAYSENEIAEAAKREDPHAYYAARFCAKEAVFKALGISGEHVKFREIEILSDENGCPFVRLGGDIARAAVQRGIDEALVSISSDGDYVQAFAIAQGKGASPGKELL